MLLFYKVRATRLLLSITPWKRDSRPWLKLLSERSRWMRRSESRMILARALEDLAPKPCSLSTRCPALYEKMALLNLVSCRSMFFDKLRSL